jgi:hypothetical protein
LTDLTTARRRWARNHFFRTKVIPHLFEEVDITKEEATTDKLKPSKVKRNAYDVNITRYLYYSVKSSYFLGFRFTRVDCLSVLVGRDNSNEGDDVRLVGTSGSVVASSLGTTVGGCMVT